MSKLVVVNDSMFLSSARRLLDAGELTVEQYATILRRSKQARPLSHDFSKKTKIIMFWSSLHLDCCGGLI